MSTSENQLTSQEFDAETRELIGLDDIKEILGEIDRAAQLDVEALEQQAKAVKDGTPNTERADEAVESVEEDNEDGRETEPEEQTSASS